MVEYLCSVFSVYDNLVFLRMPVAQSRLANGFGVSPLWPDVHRILFRFPVTWCCTNVERSLLLRSRLWCLLFLFTKASLVLVNGAGRGRKTNPFKFVNDKMLSSVFPGTFRTSSVCSNEVLITEDAVLQSRVSKYVFSKKKKRLR